MWKRPSLNWKVEIDVNVSCRAENYQFFSSYYRIKQMTDIHTPKVIIKTKRKNFRKMPFDRNIIRSAHTNMNAFNRINCSLQFIFRFTFQKIEQKTKKKTNQTKWHIFIDWLLVSLGQAERSIIYLPSLRFNDLWTQFCVKSTKKKNETKRKEKKTFRFPSVSIYFVCRMLLPQKTFPFHDSNEDISSVTIAVCFYTDRIKRIKI